MLGDKPATRPAVVIDALQEAEKSEESFNDGARDVEVTEAVVDDAKMVGESASGDFVVEDVDEKVPEGDVEVKQQVENKVEVKTERQRKKKCTRENKFEKAMSVIVDKMSKANKESDEIFVKLEEKRMKLEERMMEMEFERMREDKARQESQRREEREFQLRMMMMMTQQGSMGSLSAPFAPAYNYNAHNCSSSSGSNTPQWPDSEM